MLRVGLTGGIGAGKSTVAGRLAELGAVVVDADLLAREVVAPGTEGLARVAAAFGVEVLAADGSLDRAALGRLVFADPAARAELESITHPLIRELTEARMAAAPRGSVVLHDVPLLVELGYGDRYHLVVVVHADAEERVRRVVAERGSEAADARRRVAAQADDEQRRAAADVWLDNTAGRDDLRGEVDRLWRDRLVPFERNVRERRPAPTPDDASVVRADASWPTTARRLADRVRRAAGPDALSVDHVGPTSVPGLAAEDVIDLQLVVEDLRVADALTSALADAGFPRVVGTWPDTVAPGEEDPRGERLHGSADPARPVRLHVRAAGSPAARDALQFRDWLRADAAAREDYAALRRRLAVEHRTRTARTAAEESWVTTVARPRILAWQRAGGATPEA